MNLEGYTSLGWTVTFYEKIMQRTHLSWFPLLFFRRRKQQEKLIQLDYVCFLINLMTVRLTSQKVITVYLTEFHIILIYDLDIELNKKRRDTKLIARRFEDILSSLSSDRKNSVLKFKGANIQYNMLIYRNSFALGSHFERLKVVFPFVWIAFHTKGIQICPCIFLRLWCSQSDPLG